MSCHEKDREIYDSLASVLVRRISQKFYFKLFPLSFNPHKVEEIEIVNSSNTTVKSFYEDVPLKRTPSSDQIQEVKLEAECPFTPNIKVELMEQDYETIDTSRFAGNSPIIHSSVFPNLDSFEIPAKRSYSQMSSDNNKTADKIRRKGKIFNCVFFSR